MGVVVCREEHPQGKTLREVVASRVAAEMTRLTGYSVIENVETEWGGAPAIEVISRWRHEGEIVYGRQAHFVDGDTWTMFSLSGPWASREACDGWLADIRASLRLRSDS